MHKLYCNQHAMFTICILFSTLTPKAKGIVKVHQSNLQTSKIIPRRNHAPGSEIPGSATDNRLLQQQARGTKDLFKQREEKMLKLNFTTNIVDMICSFFQKTPKQHKRI